MDKKITLRELQAMSKSLEKLMTKDLPVKIAYKISKLTKVIMRELSYMEDVRQNLIRQLGEKNKNGELEVTDKRQEFFDKMDELSKAEIDIAFEPIKLDDITDIKLSPIDMANLDIFLEKESDDR